jgi:hypothetical protein
MVLFCAPEGVRALRDAISIHALRMDGDEPGAAANRVKFVTIRQGESAAGYVAKYVSKNIDGGGIDVVVDLAGDRRYEPSQRVEAWASTWGIRQFQQIGGPPVGVWRELRRLEKGGEYSERVEAARAAADCGPLSSGDGVEQKTAEFWARYVTVQGGPVVARKNLPVVLAKTAAGERLELIGGERVPCPAPSTRYGEIAPGVVVGVRDAVKDRSFFTNRGRWEIRRGKGDRNEKAGLHGVQGARVLDVGNERQCEATAKSAAEFGASVGGALGVDFRVSRTRGNNCTPSKFGGQECCEELQRGGVDLAERERLFGWFLSRQTQGVGKWN